MCSHYRVRFLSPLLIFSSLVRKMFSHTVSKSMYFRPNFFRYTWFACKLCSLRIKVQKISHWNPCRSPLILLHSDPSSFLLPRATRLTIRLVHCHIFFIAIPQNLTKMDTITREFCPNLHGWICLFYFFYFWSTYKLTIWVFVVFRSTNKGLSCRYKPASLISWSRHNVVHRVWLYILVAWYITWLSIAHITVWLCFGWLSERGPRFDATISDSLLSRCFLVKTRITTGTPQVDPKTIQKTESLVVAYMTNTVSQ